MNSQKLERSQTIKEWHEKPSESYTEIFKYLKSVYRNIRGKIKFPVPIPKLEDMYKEYFTKEFKDKMYEECADLRSLGEENLETLLEQHVLNPLSTKNFLTLKQKVERIVTRFLGNLNFLAEIDENVARGFGDKHIKTDDEAILKFVKTISRDVDTVDDITYSILNSQLKKILIIVKYAQKQLYLKYGCLGYYEKEVDKIKETTIELILTELDISHGKLLTHITVMLKKSLEVCLKEFKKISENELVELYVKNPTVKNYMDSYNDLFVKLVSMFKESAAQSLGEIPTEVLLFKYVKELQETLENTVIVEKLYKTVMQDPTKMKKTLYEELDQIFHDFFISGTIPSLFDEATLRGRENALTVFKILLLTDYVEYFHHRYDFYFEILERVYMGFIVNFAEKEPVLKEIWELINTKENYMANRFKLEGMLAKEMAFWSKTASESTNYFALMSVFMVFNAVLAENMSTRYTNHLRCMIKSVFRNYQNGMYRFTNFQILCAFESLIIEYKKPMRSKSLRRMDTAPLQRELLERIRATTISSYEQQSEYKEQLASIEAQINANITKPDKFIFEKISSPEVKSKTIVICISGFTSEDAVKSEEWNLVSEAYPNTEFLALHWRSNTMTGLFEFVVNEANEVIKAKEGLTFGFALPSLKTVTVGLMAYKAIKGLASNQWANTYKEAITTGIYLAHILAETELFKDYVVNLISFSLGTMVVMNCIWELEKMGRHDVIYDVLLMGGVVDVGDFNGGAMSVIGHKLFNCYCHNDYILRYILKAANFGANPIGLGPILSTNKKVVNLDVTKDVDGHTRYRENLYNVISRIDFNEDFRYMIAKE